MYVICETVPWNSELNMYLHFNDLDIVMHFLYVKLWVHYKMEAILSILLDRSEGQSNNDLDNKFVHTI